MKSLFNFNVPYVAVSTAFSFVVSKYKPYQQHGRIFRGYSVCIKMCVTKILPESHRALVVCLRAETTTRSTQTHGPSAMKCPVLRKRRSFVSSFSSHEQIIQASQGSVMNLTKRLRRPSKANNKCVKKKKSWHYG